LIHDHAGSSCCFKIIEGQSTETIYERTDRTLDGEKLVRPVTSVIYKKNEICAANSGHIHRISNEGSADLITMHCYSPPLNMNTYLVDPIWYAGNKPNASMVSGLKVN